jgi:RNase P/RNase MRP subunit p29
MEELIGRKVRITLIGTHGYVVLSGEVLKIDHPFIQINTLQGMLYLSVNTIKTIELV